MRIERLDLIKYGPFTDKSLLFADGREGLHIVFGPNEAGKSSALRGLRDALYGIPAKSSADFIHQYRDLRIGFTLVAKDGIPLAAVRRKGNTNTLTTPDTDEPIAESALSRYLADVPRETFESMFGLDYEALVEGGREIVALEGRVGATLFTAASGVSKLRELLKRLEADAAAIYAPRGQKNKLNAQLSEYRECVQRGKERASSARYGELRKKRDELLATIAQQEESLRSLRAEATRLERLRSALTPLSQRKHYLSQLASHAATRLLRSDFATELRRIREQLLKAQTDWDNEHTKWEKSKQRREELQVCDWPADVRTAIRALSQTLGAYRSAQNDVEGLRTKLSVGRDNAQRILARLRPELTIDQASQLRLRLADEEAIEQLATQKSELDTRRTNCLEQRAEAERSQSELAQQAEQLERPADVAGMQSAIDEILELGPIEKRIDEKRSELAQESQRLERELRALGRWSTTLLELEGVILPGTATVQRFDEQLRSKNAELQDAKKRIKAAERTLAVDRQAQSVSREQVGELPTESDVTRTRDQRGQVWQVLRTAFLKGELDAHAVQSLVDIVTPSDVLPDSKPALANLFELSMDRADQVVDRVRREQERVAEQVRLSQVVADGEREVEELRDELDAVSKQHDELLEEWRNVWTTHAIEVGTPAEMREWLHAVQVIRKARLDGKDREHELEEVERQRAAARSCLSEQFVAADESTLGDTESLRSAVRRAQKWVEHQTTLTTNRRTLERDRRSVAAELLRRQQQLEDVEREITQWRDAWASALTPLRLPADTQPQHARSFLRELREMFTFLDPIDGPDGYSRRLEQIAEHERTFRETVAALSRRCGIKATESLEEATGFLSKALSDVETTEREIAQLEKELPRLNERCAQLRTTVDGLNAELKRLCEEAGCANAEQLDFAWSASEERRKWQTQLDESEQVLLGLAGGKSIDELEREAADVDASQLEAQRTATQESIEKLESELKPQRGELGQLNGDLARIESDDRGLATSAELQARLAKIEQDAVEYARIHLASVVLRRAIESFAQRNQGSMLRRGSQLFSQLTRGSFAGLKIDYDGKDEPILVGQRSGSGDLITVEAMSEGTADQLYFAMRLAHLADWLEHHEPLPVVVDDILIKFDDERSKATLQVLAEFSRQTQVILFTHHGHLIELAREAVPRDQLFIHSL